MLVVPEGAEGGLEVLLAVLRLPPAIKRSETAPVVSSPLPAVSTHHLTDVSCVAARCDRHGQSLQTTGSPRSHPPPAVFRPADTFPARLPGPFLRAAWGHLDIIVTTDSMHPAALQQAASNHMQRKNLQDNN